MLNQLRNKIVLGGQKSSHHSSDEDILAPEHQHTAQKRQQSVNRSREIFGKNSKYCYRQQRILAIQLESLDPETESQLKIRGSTIIYELQSCAIVYVGATKVRPAIGDEIGVYFINSCTNQVLHPKSHKELIKVEENRFDPVKGNNFLEYNYWIYMPRFLTTASMMFNYRECDRMVVLNQYISDPHHQTNLHMIIGNIGHSIMEGFSKKTLNPTLQNTQIYTEMYKQNLFKMYLLGLQLEEYLKICRTKFDNLIDWYRQHILLNKSLSINPSYALCDFQVVQSEATIENEYFGLKGVIDLLLKCTVVEKGREPRRVFLVLELKTGQSIYKYNKDQVQLYLLLLSMQYQLTADQCVGLLFLCSKNQSVLVTPDARSAGHMISRRNRIVRQLQNLYDTDSEKQEVIKLPALAEATKCDKCQMRTECLAAFVGKREYLKDPKKRHKSVKDIQRLLQEDLEEVSNFKRQSFKQIVEAASEPESKDYLRKWFNLLHMEELEERKNDDVFIKQGLGLDWKVGDLPQTFAQQCRFNLRRSGFSKTQLTVIEYVICEKQNIRVSIQSIGLNQRCLVESVQSYGKTFIIQLKINIPKCKTSCLQGKMQQIFANIGIYRKNRHNENRFMIKELVLNPVHQQLKSLIVNDSTVIDADSWQELPQLFVDQVQNCKQFQYNQRQKEAFRKALTMKKFSLVQGMPGCGKTFIIVRLIDMFAQLGKKVLVTTYTNSALDNILIEVKKQGKVSESLLIRQGSMSAVHPENLSNYFPPNKLDFKTITEFKSFYSSKTVWFVTMNSLGLSHLPVDFDLTIVDEASQCLQPLCITALMKAPKFIMIGDYLQLQPLVKSHQAINLGMGTSLFERLCKFDNLKTSLCYQFRMNKDIMELSNRLVYFNELRPGSQTVSAQKMQISDSPQAIQLLNQIPKFFKRVLDPAKSIVVINLDTLEDQLLKNAQSESGVSRLLQKVQVNMACYILEAYKVLSPKSKITVLAFYNNTVNKVIDTLAKHNGEPRNRSIALTVDRSQGLDKDCIVFIVQSNQQRDQLMASRQRINVSLTRARSKLILLMSKRKTRGMLGGQLASLLGENERILHEDVSSKTAFELVYGKYISHK